jgi:hypothetical protein
VVERRERFFRIHHRGRAPWWFSNGGTGRFDLSEGGGTCYLAERPVGAFIEIFRNEPVIAEQEIDARLLATLSTRKRSTVADCTAAKTRRFGITAAIHTQPDYELTRRWAEAFAQAGFDGVRYRVSHDPSQRELGVALFGPAGEQDWPVHADDPIGDDVIEEARARFGLIVAPAPA